MIEQCYKWNKHHCFEWKCFIWFSWVLASFLVDSFFWDLSYYPIKMIWNYYWYSSFLIPNSKKKQIKFFYNNNIFIALMEHQILLLVCKPCWKLLLLLRVTCLSLQHFPVPTHLLILKSDEFWSLCSDRNRLKVCQLPNQLYF